ncbi:MAG: glycoside hydrolase family 32 protein [Candidatus Merdivicinus sp.]|jgi:fructan beta-fructosidase
MSTNGIRDFRPRLHFTPERHWINDPNGLVFENGRYHLFYQYYPEDTVWGPMHWGHAVSTDLIRWEHLPIALYPDELGYIFSGSAVYDSENTSGFGKNGQPPIVAMFTHHGKSEQQSIAFSLDGITFEKYAGNPVIPNTELQDFRDPKIFRNPIKNCWGVVLAAGDRVHFYASEDLKHWQKTGEFGPEGNYSLGVWECPDLFPLEIGGETMWVLLVSMGTNEANHGSRTQYFLGNFDGNTFRCDGRFSEPEFLDCGFDNYAGVTYDHAAVRTLIGWGLNWKYADKTPTGDFRGLMTIPRHLSLRNTPGGGVRLAQDPVVRSIFDKPSAWNGEPLSSEVFLLTVSGKGPCTVCLQNDRNQKFLFGVDSHNHIWMDRTQAGQRNFSEAFSSEWYSKISAPRFYEGEWKMELLFDRSVCELFVDYGTRCFSQVLYPDIPYTLLSLTGDAKAFIQTIR